MNPVEILKNTGEYMPREGELYTLERGEVTLYCCGSDGICEPVETMDLSYFKLLFSEED